MPTPKPLLLTVLFVLVVTACAPKITKEPSPVSSTDQENNVIIPVTGKDISEESNQQSPSAGNVPVPVPNSRVNEKQVNRSACVLDGNQPRHIGGCMDYFSPSLANLNNSNSTAPGTPCIPEDDQPRHHSMCVK